MADSGAHLRSVLVRLKACQAELTDTGEIAIAKLLGIVTLEVRLRLNGMGDTELRAISDAIADDESDLSYDIAAIPIHRRC